MAATAEVRNVEKETANGLSISLTEECCLPLGLKTNAKVQLCANINIHKHCVILAEPVVC